MSTPSTSIAIIGSGLAGLSLALTVDHFSSPDNPIKCTVYEQSPPTARFSGAIMMSPNSLSILDKLGIYKLIRDKGFNFEFGEFKDSENETTGRLFFGSERVFGYKGLRIYRSAFVEILHEVARERGIEVVWNKKFEKVVSESADGVEAKFTDGSTIKAGLLVGADGIHSKVRNYLAPGKAGEPVYGGVVAVVGVVKRDKLIIPPGELIKGPLQYPGRAGMFILAPQDVDGSELMAGTQRRHPEQSREGWEKFAADKDGLRGFLRVDMEGWPEIVRTAIQGIDMSTSYIWPMFAVPRLERWVSEKKKVVVMGDAAHAIPPTLGQGANQAIEDGFSLAKLLSNLSVKVTLEDVLAFWEETRKARVDRLIEMTRKMNNARLPKVEQEKLGQGEVWRDEDQGRGEGRGMEWLFVPRLEEDIEAWVGKMEGRRGQC